MLKLVSQSHELLFLRAVCSAYLSGMQESECTNLSKWETKRVILATAFWASFVAVLVCLTSEVWFYAWYLERGCPNLPQGSSILTDADCGRGISHLVKEALGWANAWVIVNGAVFALLRKWSMAVCMVALLVAAAIVSYGVKYSFQTQM